MNEKETGGPAFPRPFSSDDADPDLGYPAHVGMTLRQYAAIKLKVPNSGTDWPDKMIVASLRDDFAAKAMQGFCSGAETGDDVGQIPSLAYLIGDATLEARKS